MQTTARLVRLHSVTDPSEAESVKKLLKRNDIQCAVEGGYQSGYCGIFRLSITVWEKDYDRAKQLLDQHYTKT